MERRAFLSAITVTAGGAFFSGLAPASILEASSGFMPVAAGVDAVGYDDPCGDWQLDDMCSAYPPYAFRTGAAVPHTRPLHVDATGADWHWVA